MASVKFNRYGNDIETRSPGMLLVRTITTIRELINSRRVRFTVSEKKKVEEQYNIQLPASYALYFSNESTEVDIVFANAVERGYNDIGLCDTSSITSDILW